VVYIAWYTLGGVYIAWYTFLVGISPCICLPGRYPPPYVPPWYMHPCTPLGIYTPCTLPGTPLSLLSGTRVHGGPPCWAS